MIITDVDRVEIMVSRWEVSTKVVHTDGSTEEFVASADQHYTSNSGIWYGTAEQYKEYT